MHRPTPNHCRAMKLTAARYFCSQVALLHIRSILLAVRSRCWHVLQDLAIPETKTRARYESVNLNEAFKNLCCSAIRDQRLIIPEKFRYFAPQHPGSRLGRR